MVPQPSETDLPSARTNRLLLIIIAVLVVGAIAATILVIATK